MIKKTQKLYLKSGKMETRIYENRMQSYSERLAEIEEKIANVEAEKAIKKGENKNKNRKSFFERIKIWWKEGKKAKQRRKQLKKELTKKKEKMEKKTKRKSKTKKKNKTKNLPENFKNLKGVGPKTLEKLKDYDSLNDLKKALKKEKLKVNKKVKRRVNSKIRRDLKDIKTGKNNNKSGTYDYRNGGWEPESLINKIKKFFKVKK